MKSPISLNLGDILLYCSADSGNFSFYSSGSGSGEGTAAAGGFCPPSTPSLAVDAASHFDSPPISFTIKVFINQLFD